MKTIFKQDKGQAGLTIMLSVIVMLFIIGLIVMIFSLMSSEMKDATYTQDVAIAVINESAIPKEAGTGLVGASARDGTCTNSAVIINATNSVGVSAGNYTISTGCVIDNSTQAGLDGYSTTWLVTYTYTTDADNTATNVMNDTASSLAGTTDWFDIFIVITAMVVLILLTVIIITAIRSSGMVAGETSGANKVGTA